MSKATIKKQEITNFFEDQYTEYVKYVIEQRAIPSIIDGLKPGARKILYAALDGFNKTTPQPMKHLVGQTFSKAGYHHGDASLEDTIIKLGAAYSSNSAPLYIKGTGGTLREPKAAAGRYLKVMLSEESDLYLFDREILEFNYDGDERIEPKHYLPIIPTLLTNRTGGVAIAYSFENSMSYSIPSIAMACLDHLSGKKKLTKLEPYVKDFKGTFQEGEEGRWISRSIWKRVKNTIHVEDLPVAITINKFDENLATLLEKDIILDWENKSKRGEIKYVIHFNKTKLDRLQKSNRLEKTLKIADTSKKPNLTVLDEHGKIMARFGSTDDIIRYFVDYRLKRYDDRKKYQIDQIKARINKATQLAKFIKMVIDKTLELRNRPIKEIKDKLTKAKLDHFVLDVKITKQTKEEWLKLQKEIKDLQIELAKLEKTTTKSMYRSDLKLLIKKYAHQKNNCEILPMEIV